jgi:hypothetical protein
MVPVRKDLVAARGKRETVEKVERGLRVLVAVRQHLRWCFAHSRAHEGLHTIPLVAVFEPRSVATCTVY